MCMEIKPIRIPRNVIRELPPPVVRATDIPVVRQIEVPVIDVPNPVIEYPTIDVPTREEFEGMRTQEESKPEKPAPTRDLPPPTPVKPQVNIPYVGPVDLPPVAPLITSGATAVVTTAAALGATIVFTQLKQVGDPIICLLYTSPSPRD